MKKGLIFLLGIISFLGMNSVSADTITNSLFYNRFETYVNDYFKYEENINYMINYWHENYSIEYPYYVLEDINSAHFTLYYSKYNFISYMNQALSFSHPVEDDLGIHVITYNVSSKEYSFTTSSYPGNSGGYNVLLSNGLIYKGVYPDTSNQYDNFLIPSYTSDNLNVSFPEIQVFVGDVFPTIMDLYDGSYFSSLTEEFEEINLNDYAYVALSLKDYNNIPESNSSTYTNVYVKGQLCITPVYNYGMTERKDILTGTQIQGCSQYYNDYTLNRMYILKDDVENHAIYYLKTYDISKDNYVKVDTTKFNISYILPENEDNPEVLINGKLYPTISYNSLTDTATKSEADGYIPGVSCPVGDFNCYTENNPNNIFDSIFSSPLEILKNLWSSITSIFDIIVEFISLLPETMQSFLYLSFMIAIILGLIKLIL